MIAGAILVAVLVLVGLFLYQQGKSDACTEWQEKIRAMSQMTEEELRDYLQGLEGQPLKRPEGCATPDL